MPKKSKLTANNVLESYGWVEPILEEKDGFYGTKEDYSKEVGADFARILKENLGFDLEADSEDVNRRIIFTTEKGKKALDKYLEDMNDANAMPDCPQKVQKIEKAAKDMINILYEMLAKGRFVFIPLGESEPRQLRYDAKNKRFAVSVPLNSIDTNELNNKFVPRDEKGNVISYEVKENIKLDEPEPVAMSMPQPPKEVKPFTMLHPSTMKPFWKEPPKFRPCPTEPKDMLKEKPREEWVKEEFERLKKEANYTEPQYIFDIPKEPVFLIKPPKEVKFPGAKKTGLVKPEKPAEQAEYEKIIDELDKDYSEEPDFPEGFYQMSPKPAPLFEVTEPVLDEPVAPDEPQYQALHDEPKFKYMFEPTFMIEVPEWHPTMERPVEPKPPVMPKYPKKPVLRKKPDNRPVEPSMAYRFFHWGAMSRYNQAKADYDKNLANWEEERKDYQQMLSSYEMVVEIVNQQAKEALEKYNREMKDYIGQMTEYNNQLEQYKSQVEDLDAINTKNYEEYVNNKKLYDQQREELGAEYDAELQRFNERHAKWEQENAEIIQANKALEEQYLNSPEYKKYEVKAKWYNDNIKPYELDHNKIEEVKKKHADKYKEDLKKLEELKEAHKAYEEELKPGKKLFEKQIRILHGDEPDYEQKKDGYMEEFIARNEKENVKYTEKLKAYNTNRNMLLNRKAVLVMDPTRLQYVKDLDEYELNNEKVQIDRSIKTQYDNEVNKVDLDYHEEKEPTKEEQEKINKELDKAIMQGNINATSNMVTFKDDENGNTVKKYYSDELKKEYEKLYGDEDVDEDYDLEENRMNYSFVDDDFTDLIEITKLEEQQIKYHQYLKDLKKFERLEKRHEQKHKEWEEEIKRIQHNNENYNAMSKQYDNHLDDLYKKASDIVDEKVKQNRTEMMNYPDEIKKWDRDKIQYNKSVYYEKIDYNSRSFKWYEYKEEYEEKEKLHNSQVKKYAEDLENYQNDIKTYTQLQEDYNRKLNKYKEDLVKYKQIEFENDANLKEYNNKKKEYIQKVCKDPKLKDYYENKGQYFNGDIKWSYELQTGKKVSNWRSKYSDDKKLDSYFNRHQRIIAEYGKFKNRANAVTKIDDQQQKMYEEHLAEKKKYARYTVAAKPLFKMIRLYYTQIEDEIDKVKVFNDKNYAELASMMMYMEVVESFIQKEYDLCANKADFDPCEYMKYLEKDNMTKSIKAIRKDPVFMKEIKSHRDWAIDQRNPNEELAIKRQKFFLKDAKYELKSIFENAHKKENVVAKDPIFSGYLGPFDKVLKKQYEDMIKKQQPKVTNINNNNNAKKSIKK
ncbi:MAG: hypothetical protein K5659_09905 [Lachnospiraceae bacterium]|nr:hypothetical protein [Lachnospiraceae bacterium]